MNRSNATNGRPFPVFETDKEAEDFVATADLSEYDFSGFKRRSLESVIAEFEKKNEYKKKQKVLRKRLPETLLEEHAFN